MNLNLKTLYNLNDNFYYAGSILKDDELQDWCDVHEALKSVKDVNDILRYLSDKKGFFSVVLKVNTCFYLITDHVNSYPLYYRKNLVIDTAIRNELSKDGEAFEHFKMSGVVPGIDTLVPGLKSVEPGSILSINTVSNERFTLKYHELFSFNKYSHSIISLSDWEYKYSSAIVDVINEIRVLCQNSHVILPLSGGFDSRLVAHIINSAGLNNVTCFTYGDKDDPEVEISKRLAEFYSFDWHFIEHDSNFWKNLKKNVEYNHFVNEFCSPQSVVHVQDFGAVKYLNENGLIHDNSIIVPGHAMDYLAGNHIPTICFNSSNVKVSELVDYIVNRHYSLHFRTKEDTEKAEMIVYDFIKREFQQYDKDYIDSRLAIFIYQRFNFIERQSKFILNSLMVYKFYRLKFYLPLWSLSFCNYYESLESELFKNRFVSVTWDVNNLKSHFDEELKNLAYNENLVKPSRSVMFLKIRRILLFLGLYRTLLRINLVKKVFIENKFRWFDLIPTSEKVFGVFKGYKEIYSFLVNLK